MKSRPQRHENQDNEHQIYDFSNIDTTATSFTLANQNFSDKFLGEAASMLLLLFVVLTFLPLANLLPLDGQNKGCAHDGKEVDVGETLVVGCDTCTCIPG